MIQEFDFSIEHVAGDENIVADAFSRLVEMPRNQEVALLLANTSMVSHLPEDIFKHIATYHNTNVGHFGVAATMKKLQDAGHTWPLS